MDIYTVTSRDELDMEPSEQCVAGSWLSRGDALRECAEYVMERARIRPGDIGHMLRHDELHPDFPKRGRGRQMAYILDELGQQGCYHVYCEGYGSVRFDVDENGVSGDLWTLVTWGGGGFKDPFPETFTSVDSALEAAKGRLAELMGGSSPGKVANAKKRIVKGLVESGRAGFWLDDGDTVHWSLRRFGACEVRDGTGSPRRDGMEREDA